MKILTLCYEYPPIGGGGGRVAASVARGLASRGHEVKVVTAGMKHLPRYAVIDGVEVYRPQSFRKSEDRCSVYEMALYLVTSFYKALKLAWTWRPDVIHAHFVVPTGALAYVVSLLSRTPYVVTAHLGDVPGGVPEQTKKLFSVFNPFARCIVNRADKVTAVSTYVGELLMDAYQCRAEVIVNGIDLRDAPIVISKGTTLRMIMVGRMNIQKNPLLAIDACAMLNSDDWHLDLVGNGPLVPKMKARVDDLGIGHHVTFHGWLDTNDVHSLLKKSDVFLMPSLSEGLPVAAIEALKYGVAIVGSSIPGLRDVLLDGYSGLACDMTTQSFSQALENVVFDDNLLGNLRLGALSHSSNFDLMKIVERYEECLMQAHDQPNPDD